jgi:hypothetical protein
MRRLVLCSGCDCLSSECIVLHQSWTQLIDFFELICIVRNQVLKFLHTNLVHLDEHVYLIDRFLELKLDFRVILGLKIFARDSYLLLETVDQSSNFLLDHEYRVFGGAINFIKQILENVSFGHNFTGFLNECLVTLCNQRIVISNFLESGLYWRLFWSRIPLLGHTKLLLDMTLSTFNHFCNILFIT